jgi:hypothetical protein
MKNAYERFVRPLLFLLDPETAHHFAIAMLRHASRVDLVLGFSTATEAKNSIRADLSESNWSGRGFRQERGRASDVGSTRLRLHRDRNGYSQGPARKFATAHLSFSRTTSAD